MFHVEKGKKEQLHNTTDGSMVFKKHSIYFQFAANPLKVSGQCEFQAPSLVLPGFTSPPM